MIAPISGSITNARDWQSRPDCHPVYTCPHCKSPLRVAEYGLHCVECDAGYPILEGIPDFIGEEYRAEFKPILRFIDRLGLHARLYETPLWYNPVLHAFGGKDAPSFEECQKAMGDLMDVRSGLLVDIACGPGTWGRRIASDRLSVYGIDLSWGMLRQGAAMVRRGRIPNVHFAHALVESLPFGDAIFDAAYCGGSLHLFPDTVGALRRIGRTLKPGAPLVVLTFLKAGQQVVKWRQAADKNRKRRLRAFEIPEMAGYLDQAGFTDFEPQQHGAILIFTARKGSGRERR